ncbi:MAG: hypothetical protein EA351_02580 [Gemmatimonadales bacterium]|nr:MAG: hypothetical protein EA351_02580 [Gemmatimonadales bacterium]
MSETKLGEGFRFGKLVAWAPAIVLVVAFLLIVTGEFFLGLMLVAFALLLWLMVRRRRRLSMEGESPSPLGE